MGMFSNGQFFFLGGAGYRPVNGGEFASAIFIPFPNFWGNIAVFLTHVSVRLQMFRL